MAKRRTLTEEEKIWADNLKSIWNAKKSALGLTQEKAAAKLGWNSQAAVGQYLNGNIPLNTDAKSKFAALLDVSVTEIDPDMSSVSAGLRPDQAELVERYESLPPEAQKAFLVFLESLERH